MATKILDGVSGDYDEYIVMTNGMFAPAQFKTLEEAERFLYYNSLRPLGHDRDAFKLVEGAGMTILFISAATVEEVEEWEIWN